MHTIWFRLPDSAQQLHTDVQSLTRAQEVWDRLSGSGFEMISARP